MSASYTLEQLASPMSPVSSTASISVSISGDLAGSFSLPPFLYYATKAKMLARLGVRKECDAIEHGHMDVRKAIIMDMRDIAKSVHRDIHRHNLDMDNYISAAIQSRILFKLLGENEPDMAALNKKAATPINASRSKKNVTIPAYLFDRISALFGGDKAARLQVHAMVLDIKNELEKEGLIAPDGKTTGNAANSSWSRKLHNKLFIELIKMSTIQELHTSPSIFEVEMLRESKLETKVRSGKLKVAS